jgi:hypothetical protein
LRSAYPDQAALTSFWNGILIPTDFVLPVGSSDPNYGSGIKATRMTSANLIPGVTSTAQRLNGQNAWIVYDLEASAPGVTESQELQDELKDYVNSVRTAAAAVHANGGKLVFTPTYPDILTYGAGFAPYCDLINMQISPYTPGYEGRVESCTRIVKTANPEAIVLVQLGALTGTSPEQNTDPADAIVAWNSVRNIVDGLLIDYVNSPDPIPILKQFCAAILTPQRSRRFRP